MIKRGKGEEEEKGKGFMDWDWKPASWDFSGLERESNSNIAPIVRSSSLGGEQSKKDCSVDLKLGRLGDLGSGSVDRWQDPRVTMVSSPLGSSKKARAPSNETQTVSCLVDGCDSDLSKCRDYHRRHKVCEVHSKTPKVMVGGQEQRFCQQCSRFHSLLEFDEVKRSCRKRLDGHNRRRRKSQPESLSMNSGSLLSNHQGTRYLQFTSPQLFQSTMVGSPRHVMKTKDDTELYSRHQSLHLVDGQNPFPRSFSCNFKGGKQYPFLHGDDPGLGNPPTVPEVSFCQPLVHSVASSSQSSEASRKMLSDGFTNRVVIDSDCALSLLSSPPSRQSSGISQADMVHTNSIPMAHPLVGGLQYDGLLEVCDVINMYNSPWLQCQMTLMHALPLALVFGAWPVPNWPDVCCPEKGPAKSSLSHTHSSSWAGLSLNRNLYDLRM
ncbi:Transcription factor [Macleaya cordata]|uniref:Transcription factor n=1 Tax=Macleaya cordata TaxID=56857 RepID=A0A200R461_MACCD|nr:Transcription factor [Macleaya cordata]